MKPNVLQLLEEVKRVTKRSELWDDGNALANILRDMSSCYSSLIGPLAEAEKASDEADMNFKLRRERAKQDRIRNKEAIKNAETASLLDAEAEWKEAIQLKYYARLLFLTRQSLDKSMDSTRSILTQMRHDKEGANHV